jgi:hypothetical protein
MSILTLIVAWESGVSEVVHIVHTENKRLPVLESSDLLFIEYDFYMIIFVDDIPLCCNLQLYH